MRSMPPLPARRRYTCAYRAFATATSMRIHTFPFPTIVLGLAWCVLASPALPQDRPERKESKRAWTNADLEHLAARPLANAASPPASEASAQTTSVEKHRSEERRVGK